MITLQPIPSPAPRAGKSILLHQLFPVLGLCLTLLLCGCASESPWKKETFALTAPSAKTGAGAHTNILCLRRVTVSPLYGGKLLVYRTGENGYERDPYAEFLVPPNQMMDECLRFCLRDGHAFAAVLEPDSGLKSSCFMDVSVSQLYGDFRQFDKPFAVLQMRFVLYVTTPANDGRMIWQREFSKRLPLAHRTSTDLVAVWDTELQEIMDEANTNLRELTIPEIGTQQPGGG
jgi:ABC-type uncharacterized transport system auxiliary subunit